MCEWHGYDGQGLTAASLVAFVAFTQP